MALLEVHEVSHRFGGNVVLDRVSIDAEAGRITGLIGPNGAGKSTLFAVVAGSLTPSQGRVTFAGVDLEDCAPYRRARLGIGRTFQRLETFGSLTVRESIGLAATVQRRQRTAGSRVDIDIDIDEIVSRFGLEHLADVRTDMLPTGQARLAELGRALAIRPRLLLLDEPASGLDEAETEQLAAALGELARSGIGVLLVEHDMGLVMRACTTVHVLDQGVLIASGAPTDVGSDPLVRASYLGHDQPPNQPNLVKEATMADAPTVRSRAGDRLDRLRSEVAATHLGGSAADKDVSRARLGGVLLFAGVLIGIVAYFMSHRTTDAFIQNDAIVVALVGVSVAIAGAAVYVRHGLAASLRDWSARQREP